MQHAHIMTIKSEKNVLLCHCSYLRQEYFSLAPKIIIIVCTNYLMKQFLLIFTRKLNYVYIFDKGDFGCSEVRFCSHVF